MDLVSQMETEFFRRINAVMEPMLRAGLGTPGPCANGLILLETIGRKSGRTINIPVMAAALGEWIVVSTARGGRSQWIRNLAARPEIRYWANGRLRDATAIVIAGEDAIVNDDRLPMPARYIASMIGAFAPPNFASALLIPAAA